MTPFVPDADFYKNAGSAGPPRASVRYGGNEPYGTGSTPSVTAGVIADPILEALKGNSIALGGTIPVSHGRRVINGKDIWVGEIKPDTTSSGCDVHWLATFAVSFGYSAIPLAGRPHCIVTRLWANGKELTAAMPPFTLHDGTQDPPEPDPIIKEQQGDTALSYPEQIYIVFKDFPLWKVQDPNDTQVPEITVELSDHAGDNSDVALLDSIDPNPGADTQGTIVDFEDGLYYTFAGDPTAKVMHVYDIATRAEVRTVDLDMNGQAADGFYMATSRGFLAYDKVNKLAFCNGSIFNSEPIVCFDVKSGKAMSVFGGSNSGTDNTDTGFVKTYRGWCVQCKEGGSTYNALVTLSVFYDYGVLTYNNDGTGLTFASRDTPPDTMGYSKISGNLLRCMTEYVITPGGTTCTPGTTSAKSDAYVLLGVGHVIYMLRIGARNGVVSLQTSGTSSTFLQWFTALPPNLLINGIMKDPVDGSVVVFCNDADVDTTSAVAKISVTTPTYINASFGARPVAGKLLYNKTIPEWHPIFQDSAMRYSRLNGETFIYPSSGNYVFLDLANGSYTLSPTLTTNYTPSASDYWFDGGSIFLNTGVVPYPGSTEGAVVIEFGGSAGGFDVLSDIIAWYCQLVNMTSADYDIDPNLTDKFYGGLFTEPWDVWGTLIPAMGKVCNFITYMSGGVQKFRRVGSGPDATLLFRITEDDLATVDGGASGVFEGMNTVDPAPNEMIGEASVGFINYDKDYTLDASTFHRNTFPTRTRFGKASVSYNVPLVMGALDAQARAMRLAYEPQSTMRTSNLRLGRKYWLYEPGDSGTVVTNGQEIQVLFQEMVFNGDWSVSINVADNQFSTVFATPGTVLPDTTGDPTHPPPPTVIVDPPVTPPVNPGAANSDSKPLVFDVPLLDRDDDVPAAESVLYVGAKALVTTWVGATILVDGVALGHTSTDIDVGFVADALPDEPRVWQPHDDYDIDVTLPVGVTLATVTDAEFRAGTNAALVGANGRWELIYWRDVTQLSPSQWRLSHVARGRRGTNTHVGDHASSDTFVLLPGVFPVVQPGAAISASITVSAVGDTTSVVPATVSITYAANSKKPWSPAAASAALGSTVNAVGSTSYQNACGGGTFLALNATRETLITVTGNFTPASSSEFARLVDGDDTNGATGSMVMPAGLTNAIIQFDFRPSGFKQIIDEFKWEQNNSLTQGNYDLEASDDAVSWSTLKSNFDLVGGTSLNTVSWSNSTGYWFYRLKQVSGSTSNNSCKEIYLQTMADVDPDDVLIRWQRRDRRGFGTWSDPDLPLSEVAEEYEIDIYDGSAVVRTVTDIADNLYLYSAANQATDGFTAPLDELKVAIYQISAQVGRGYAKEATLGVDS